jgi:hypothetical protein
MVLLLIRANSWASRPFIVAERETSSCKIRDCARSFQCDGCPEAPASFVVVTKYELSGPIPARPHQYTTRIGTTSRS